MNQGQQESKDRDVQSEEEVKKLEPPQDGEKDSGTRYTQGLKKLNELFGGLADCE